MISRHNFQKELCLIFAGGALLASLQDVMAYNMAPLPVLFLYCLFACVPVLLYKHSKLKIVYYLVLPVAGAAFFLLFPLIFINGEHPADFYSRFYKLALKTFQDELAGYPTPFPQLTLAAIGLLIFYVLAFLKRFRFVSYLIIFIPVGIMASSPWTRHLDGGTYILLSSTSLLSALTFLYVNHRFLHRRSDRMQLQFFIQNLVFSLLICSAVLGLSYIQIRPEEKTLIQRLSNRDTKEKKQERVSFIVIQDDKAILDLSKEFSTSPITALELLSHTSMYLTETIYTYYDGVTWSRQIQGTEHALANSIQIRNISGARDSRPIKITYKALKTKNQLYPPYLLRIDSADEESIESPDFSYTADVFSPPPNLWLTVNTVESEELLRKYSGSLDISIPPSIKRLADEITENYSTPYGKAKALENYLRSELLYSTRPPKAPEGSDLTEYFLFESGKGFCIHFASALALMAQAEGIPARVVSGFVASRGSTRTDNLGRRLYTIPFSQAHAWTEVYLPPAGWIPLDATPRYLQLYEQNYAGPSPQASDAPQEENRRLFESSVPLHILLPLMLVMILLLIPLVLRLQERKMSRKAEQSLKTGFGKVTCLTHLIKIPYHSHYTLKEYRYLLEKKLGNHSETLRYLQLLEDLIYNRKDHNKTTQEELENLYPLCRKEIYLKAPLLPYLFWWYLNKI